MQEYTKRYKLTNLMHFWKWPSRKVLAIWLPGQVDVRQLYAWVGLVWGSSAFQRWCRDIVYVKGEGYNIIKCILGFRTSQICGRWWLAKGTECCVPVVTRPGSSGMDDPVVLREDSVYSEALPGLMLWLLWYFTCSCSLESLSRGSMCAATTLKQNKQTLLG